MPTFADVEAAAVRIGPFVHRTPVLTSARLDDWLGTTAYLKGEHLQRAGAFKYRGATNAVQSLSPEDAAHGVAAHSSGNHAAALARAAATRAIAAHVVMPQSVRAVKKAAVLAYGANVTLCENTPESRAETLARVVERTGAVEIHPFDNEAIIAGAGTAALELCEDHPDLDVVVAPVGGGGLLSGTALAAHGLRSDVRVLGAEPLRADDAARSLATGRRQPPLPPATMADGLLTGLVGPHVRDHSRTRRDDRHRRRSRDPRRDADDLAVHEAIDRAVGGRGDRGRPFGRAPRCPRRHHRFGRQRRSRRDVRVAALTFRRRRLSARGTPGSASPRRRSSLPGGPHSRTRVARARRSRRARVRRATVVRRSD